MGNDSQWCLQTVSWSKVCLHERLPAIFKIIQSPKYEASFMIFLMPFFTENDGEIPNNVQFTESSRGLERARKIIRTKQLCTDSGVVLHLRRPSATLQWLSYSDETFDANSSPPHTRLKSFYLLTQKTTHRTLFGLRVLVTEAKQLSRNRV